MSIRKTGEYVPQLIEEEWKRQEVAKFCKANDLDFATQIALCYVVFWQMGNSFLEHAAGEIRGLIDFARHTPREDSNRHAL